MHPLTLKPGDAAGTIRFGGYAMTPRGKARLFLPGYQNPGEPDRYKVEGEVIAREIPRIIRLEPNGDYWLSRKEDELTPGTAYRIRVKDLKTDESFVVLDNLQTVTIKDETYNIISSFEQSMPRHSGPLASVFLDRLKSFLHLLAPEAKNTPSVPQILEKLKDAGLTGASFSPFYGGNDLSDHRHAVEDPFILNEGFGSPESFRQMLLSGMKDGTRIFASGIFFNQDISGAQYQTNISHPFRSPFWAWFHYDNPDDSSTPLTYPKSARKKQALGILPYQETPDYRQLDFHIINDPGQKDTYHPGQPTYIEFYNPIAEQALQEDLTPQIAPRKIRYFRRRFRIKPEELSEKRQLIQQLEKSTGKPVSTIDRKRIFSEGDHYRLTGADFDESGEKWNHLVSAARLNLDNPDVRNFLIESFVFWTRLARHTYVEEIATQLGQVDSNESNLASAIEAMGLTHPQESGQQILEGYRATEPRPFGGQRPTRLGALITQQVITDFPAASLAFPKNLKAMLTNPDFRKRLNQEPLPLLIEASRWFLTQLKKIPIIGHFFEWLEESNLFRPSSFDSQCTERLEESIALLPAVERKKLEDPAIRELLVEHLGAWLYLKLLTNQTSQKPEDIEPGLEKTIYDHILQGDPIFGMQALTQFMKVRLTEISTEEITNTIRKVISPLETKNIALANYLVDHRELGLNWRMGSALGMTDLEAIRQKDGEDKNAAFLQEVRKAILHNEKSPPFWREVTKAIRQVSPKTSIIAELDYDPTLSDWKTFAKALEEVTSSDTFTAIAVGANLQSNPLAMIHALPTPDGNGYQQISPYDYYKNILRPMTQELPFPALKQHQKAISTSLTSNVPHSLLLNPAIAGMDALPLSLIHI